MAELLAMSQKGTSSFYLYVGLGLLAALFQGEYSAEECPIFGTKHTTELTLRGTRRIVMNFGSPAQCKGNVTGWRFCYYQNVNDTLNYDTNYVSSRLVVFRSLNSSYSVYEPLRDNRIEIRISIEDVLNISNFTCMNVGLNPDDYFEVKENDIIGACIKGINPLILVGRSTGSNSNYHSELNCNLRNNVTTSDLTQLSDSLLHLYADIAVAASCRAGNNPPPSVAVMSGFSGTYLNSQYPVTCGSHITEWHFCYYTEAATPGSTLSMTVAVWSLDAVSNTYIVSPSSIMNITTRPVQTLAKIFCEEELLNENEYIKVSAGDVIGVVLPSNNAIPILGSGANADQYILKSLEKLSPMYITQQDFCQLRNSGMHLYTKIDTVREITVPAATDKVQIQCSNTTTSEICISEPSSEEVLTDISSSIFVSTETSRRSVSAGVISAIAVSLLLLIGILTFVITIIVFMRIQNTKKSSDEIVEDVVRTAENVCYGTSKDTRFLTNYEQPEEMPMYAAVTDGPSSESAERKNWSHDLVEDIVMTEKNVCYGTRKDTKFLTNEQPGERALHWNVTDEPSSQIAERGDPEEGHCDDNRYIKFL